MDKFAESLFKEDATVTKNIYVDFYKEDTSCMFKKAYVTSMKKPTVEKIKQHVVNRIKSEFNVQSNDVRVVISAKDSDGESVTNGDGVANVKLKGKAVKVPFKIVDGEISDFSTIGVDNEKVAYNKQSIGKLSKGDKKSNESEAFVGTSKPDNASTDKGFLDEVIKIRDSHISKQTNTSGGRYITASEACNEILQKTSEIKHDKAINYEAVECMVRQKLADEVSKKIEKIASVNIDKKVSHAQEVFSKMEQLPLKSIHSMKHGQRILFPEIRGNEMSMTAGVVFKKVDKGFYKASRYNEISSTYVAIVMSHDGRVALLGSGQTMLALEDDSAKFKFPSTRLRAVYPRQNYIAINKDSIIAPFYIEDRVQDYGPIAKELSEILGVHDPIISIKPAFVESNGWIPTTDIVLMPGEPFKSHLTSVKVGGNKRYINGMTEKLKKHLMHKPNLLASVSSMISLDSSLAADPDTMVAKINGVITGFITDKRQLNFNAGRDLESIKLANYDTLRIEKVAEDKYSVRVNGKNKKDFGKKLSKKETQTIMLSMGYKPEDVGEAMHSTNSAGRYHKQLPSSTDINKLYDGEVDSKAKKIMNKLKSQVFDKEKCKYAMKDFGINMTSDALAGMAGENDDIYAALEYLTKFAKESSAASILFEKLAMEYKSEELQNVAKIMTASHNVFNTANNVYNGSNASLFKEACESIVNNKECLEELVTGMANLSDDQFEQSDEYVPYEAIKTATEVIGAVYEFAKCATFNNQDIVCIKCGGKSEGMLQDGKCKQCADEELNSINEEERNSKVKTDEKEVDGSKVGDEDK